MLQNTAPSCVAPTAAADTSIDPSRARLPAGVPDQRSETKIIRKLQEIGVPSVGGGGGASRAALYGIAAKVTGKTGRQNDARRATNIDSTRCNSGTTCNLIGRLRAGSFVRLRSSSLGLLPRNTVG